MMLKVSEGRYGNLILNFDKPGMEYESSNKAKLACDILKSYRLVLYCFNVK